MSEYLKFFLISFCCFPCLSLAGESFENSVKSLFEEFNPGYSYRFENDYFDIGDLQPAPVFFTDKIPDKDNFSFYAFGRLHEYENDLEYYVLKGIDHSAGDSLQCDYLFVLKDTVIIGNPVKIGYFDLRKKEDSWSFYFDFSNLLNIKKIIHLFKNDIPVQVEQNTVYGINEEDRFAVLVQESDTLYDAPTYSRFKALFQPLNLLGYNSGDNEIRLAENVYTQSCFEFPGQKVYAVGSLHYRENDFFIVRPTDFDNYWGSDINTESTDELLEFDTTGVLISQQNISYFVNSEGGFYSKSYSFNSDTTLTFQINHEACCSATGYEDAFVTTYSRLYHLSGETGMPQNVEISSPLFDIDYISTLSDYNYPVEFWELISDELADKAMLQLLFSVVPASNGQKCLQFVTRLVTDTKTYESKIIDVRYLCPDTKVPLEKIKRQIKPSKIKNVGVWFPLVIRTSHGDIQVEKNGKMIEVFNAKTQRR